MESRTQGSRPRTQKNPRPKTALSRTNPLEAKDRNARGQGQGPRRQAQVFSKKKVFKIFFIRSPKPKDLQKNFQAISKRGKRKTSVPASSVRRIFEKGGPGNSENLKIIKTRMKIFPQVRFPALNLVKTKKKVFTQI